MITKSNADILIEKQIYDPIFEGIRKQSKALSMFTRLPNMTSDRTEMKVLDSLPIAYFQNADTAMKKLTEMAWKGVYIYAGEIAVIVPIAENVLNDAKIDIWATVKPSIEEAAGKLIDSAIFTGVGKPAQWREGLLFSINQAGNIVTPEENETFYFQINRAMEKVEESGYNVNGIIGGIGLKSKFRTMVDSTGQPLNTTEIGSIARTFVDNGSWDKELATAIVGDFSQAVYAMREDPTYKVLTEAVIQDPITGKILYNLAQQDMVALRFTMRLGWAIPNPVNSLEPDAEKRFPFAAIKGTGLPQTINGVIKVTSDGTAAIANAKVTLGGNEVKTKTDGTATFKVQKNQSYFYKANAKGYQPLYGEVKYAETGVTTTVTLKEDERESLGTNPAAK